MSAGGITVPNMTSLALSILSVVVASVAVAVSYVLGGRSVRAAERSAAAAESSQRLSERQLSNAVEAQDAALQPYVWADLRPRDDGQILVFVVGNSGPTVATDVRLKCSPLLEDVVPMEKRERARQIEARLTDGLRSIAPGRTYMWHLGTAFSYFPSEATEPVPEMTIEISARGPRGPLEPLEYVIALEDLKFQAARPSGVAVLEQPLKDIAKAIQDAPKG